MNEPSEQSLTELAQAAFRKAAAEVIRRAKQTGTPVIVWREGRVCAVPAEEFDERAFDEDKTTSSDSPESLPYRS